MALIEIDGLPIENRGSFHVELLNNQMVFRMIIFKQVNVHATSQKDVTEKWLG